MMSDGDIRWDDLGHETMESTKKSAGLFTEEQGREIFGHKLTLEDGKVYINGFGNRVNVYELYPDSNYPFEDNDHLRYTSDGKYVNDVKSNALKNFDLVSETE